MSISLQQQSHQAYAAAMRTVAGTRQVVMLYDGILRQLQLAKEAMESGKIEERYQRLTRASSIIFGLQSCLDYEKGGQIAPILYQFYASIDLQVFALHRTADPRECERIMETVRQMRDAWNDIDQGEKAARPPGAEGGYDAPENNQAIQQNSDFSA